jgi:hypothetical protein
VAALLLLCSGFSAGQSLRIGTYDSRAIAVAYVRSTYAQDEYRALAAEREQARAAGDESRMKAIEARGRARQERLHLQGFSTASVMEFMQKISAELPGLARQAGVLMIVSKWEVAYRDPAVEYVDLTIPIVKSFGVSAEVLKMVEEVMKHDPVPAARLELEVEH